MKTFETDQENFWAGQFGNDYSLRVKGEDILASYISMHSNIIKSTTNINSIIEFGANIGLNLDAYKILLPNAELSAIEINSKALQELNKKPFIKNIYNKSIIEYEADYQRDLVLIKGVLIHINPDKLQAVYNNLYNSSKRYICIAEYYSRNPETLEYRGHKEKLYKRDFAGEILDKFPDLHLIDYGFVYYKDNNFPIGDINWFLIEKV